jgi:hypothetical protein
MGACVSEGASAVIEAKELEGRSFNGGVINSATYMVQE